MKFFNRKEKSNKKNSMKKEIKSKEEKKRLQKEKNEADKKIRKLIYDWISIMAHTNNANELDETFTLNNIKVESYGFSCDINIVSGLSFSILEGLTMINIIEDNIGCLFITKRISKSKKMKAQFITEDIPEIKFQPLKGLKPYELYMGTSIDGNPIICSMLKYPHVIIQGATGMGKTKMIDSMITNLITQCSPEELSLYFIQADKSDQIIYRRCKHTKAYADTLEKAYSITNYLKELVNHRDKTLKPFIEDGICENIMELNKIARKYNITPFNYVYLIIDEYSSLMASDSDSKEVKTLKWAIQGNLERLIQIGRYVGIYLVIGLQRSTVDKLPSFIKAMCNTVATFRVNNEKSSYVAIDSNEAVNLNPRESIIKTNDKVLAKTTTITSPMILEYIKPYRRNNLEYKDFPYESFLNSDGLLKSKKKKKQNKNKTVIENTDNSIIIQDTKTQLDDRSLKKIAKIKDIDVIELPKDKENKNSNDDLITKVQQKKIEKVDELVNKFEIPKSKSPHLLDNWKDASNNPNIKIINKTKIDFSKTEKPLKRRDDDK